VTIASLIGPTRPLTVLIPPNVSKGPGMSIAVWNRPPRGLIRRRSAIPVLLAAALAGTTLGTAGASAQATTAHQPIQAAVSTAAQAQSDPRVVAQAKAKSTGKPTPVDALTTPYSTTTANPDGTYTDENGADLRDTSHFCAWCTEILTIRLLEKTDQFSAPGDPTDPVAQGSLWYSRWADELRENYYVLLDIENQIHDAEARYAAEHPGRAGEALWTSDLYSPPKASQPPHHEPIPPLTDAENLLLMTA